MRRPLMMRAAPVDARPFLIEEQCARYRGASWRRLDGADSEGEAFAKLSAMPPSAYRRRVVHVLELEGVANGARRSEG